MTNEEILAAAIKAGFIVSSSYGQEECQPMPVSDSATLIKFAKILAGDE